MPRTEILVTGGTGKTGRRIVARLHEQNLAARVGTRHVQSPGEVRFDWHDPASFDPALENVRAVYLVNPPIGLDSLATMQPFVDRALRRGVKRFVLLSASSLPEGGPAMGAVHAYLRAHAPAWNALRPSWFMQNFSEGQHLATIRDEGVIYSAAGAGRIPFIAADDIAAVAAHALAETAFPSGELVLTGPRALSYDEAAAILSHAAGETVVHRRLQVGEMVARFEQGGLPLPYAQALAAMDEAIAAGAEDRTTDVVEAVSGQPPGSLESFAQMHAALWQHPVNGAVPGRTIVDAAFDHRS